MTFKRRLIIAFSIMLLTPLILCSAAFFVIGNYLVGEDGAQLTLRDYAMLSENVQAYDEEAMLLYNTVAQELQRDPYILEDRAYLEALAEALEEEGRESYLIVRKGDELYYTNNENAARKIFSRLPVFRYMDGGNGEIGYYIDNLDKMVKQLDFTFSDGSEGSFFIVTRIVTLVSRPLLAGMFVAMIVILMITAGVITHWFKKGVFQPINALNVAMRNIRDGNLEYMLPTTGKGEIGDLYQNYEDMRLRLKESADEKIDRERQNRELISNISHDLKTPITSIKGYVEGIMDGVANTPEKQKKYIRTIYNKANDMDKLINELTLYARIDNDRIPYNFHKINVADYFGDCVDEIGMDMESRGIELNYSNMVSPDTLIIADPEQMKRVVNNIISNSVKYLDKLHGKIDIRILDEQDAIRVEIEDNGRGIAAKDLPNIFDRFYRTDASRNSAQGGSGIGLSIVKKIVEDHGGYIWATSRIGEGTCMHFVIRKYREVENPSVDAEASEKTEGAGAAE
ncbi:MAG: HAMP domain-containing sensor histidine kinase [Eubacteriales bacterium]|nr:HAMP domain-containing sensor histidine kinase [Eubacteriales bacterium]